MTQYLQPHLGHEMTSQGAGLHHSRVHNSNHSAQTTNGEQFSVPPDLSPN